MHVTGTVILGGEQIAVDCYSVRDRSWGPRPTGPTPADKRLPPGELPRPNKPVRASLPHSVGYIFATQDDREAFMAFTDPWVDRDERATDELDTGYLLRDGTYAPLVEGFRQAELAPETRFIRRIHLEAVDALGRELVADGELVARHGTTGPAGTGLFHWVWTGNRHGWGEDQSFGPTEWFEALDTTTT
jgi:hypothetical protein